MNVIINKKRIAVVENNSWKSKLLALAERFGLIELVTNEEENRFFSGSGYSKQAESLGNFLINSVPDGRGVFIFDPNATTLPQWPFVKVAGLTSYKEDISLLYRSIDHVMHLEKETMLSLLSVPLAENGSFDVQRTFSFAYHVKGDDVHPYTVQESEKVKSDIVSIKNVDFKTGEQWSFDPEHVPAVPSLSVK